MSKPLIAPGQLISEGWHLFTKHLHSFLQASVWFLLGPVIMLIGGLLATVSPIAATILILVGSIANLIITIWVSIRLTSLALSHSRGKTPDAKLSRIAWTLFWSFIWVMLARGWATLGGYVLLIVPGIWLSIAFMFSEYFLIEDGIKGLKALSASADLVKGRWWGTFGRTLLIGLITGLIAIALIVIFSLVVGGVAGLGGATDPSQSMFFNSAMSVLQGIMLVFLTPLAMAWQVRLFHSLKDTR